MDDINDRMRKLNADQTIAYEGACQACEGAFVVKHAGGNWGLVFHGYRRPGDGQTRGSCFGVDALPYELSCELVKSILEGLVNNLAGHHYALEQLVADKLDEFAIEVPRPAAERLPGSTRTKLVYIGRDYKGSAHYKDFQYYRRHRIDEVRSMIRTLEREIEHQAKRVADWKLAPEALRDHEKAEAERVRRTKEERETRATYRHLRRVFEYVKEAVNEHKDRHRRLEDAIRYGRRPEYIQECRDALAVVGPFVRVKPKKARK